MVAKERRSYVRGDLSFQVKYKIMTSDEFEDLKRSGKAILSSSSMERSTDIVDTGISTDNTVNAALMN